MDMSKNLAARVRDRWIHVNPIWIIEISICASLQEEKGEDFLIRDPRRRVTERESMHLCYPGRIVSEFYS